MKKEKVGIVEGLGRRLSLQSTVGGGELREVGSVVRVSCSVLRVPAFGALRRSRPCWAVGTKVSIVSLVSISKLRVLGGERRSRARGPKRLKWAKFGYFFIF